MSYLDDVFGPAGLFAQKFPGYEPRPGQVRYAREVDAAFVSGDRLLAEGPCGTGKSVAYLVPAVWHVTEGADALRAYRAEVDEAAARAGFDEGDDGRPKDTRPRVLVATANIALQEQILKKDIPLLQGLLPWKFKAAIAKGRGNYLCLSTFDDSAVELLMKPLGDYEARQQWNEVARWKATTTTGDFSELPFEVRGQLRRYVATTSDDCTGKACQRYAECHAERARRELRDADLIVCNYHLLCAHLNLAREFGVGVLPRFDLVVLDEAHELADVAREFFGFKATAGSFAWATRFLGAAPKASRGGTNGYDLDPELRQEIQNRAADLFDALAAFKRSPRYKARIVAKFDGYDWEKLVDLTRKAADLLSKSASLGPELGLGAQRIAELRKAERRCRVLASNVAHALDPDRDEEGRFAYFLEEELRAKGQTAIALRGKPVDVHEELRERVFECPAFKGVVSTSATLATGTGGDAFDFCAGEIGCTSGVELIVPSPFDFKRQALLVVPSDLPDPKLPTFLEGVAQVAADVVGAARGRTLVLCTSNRGVQQAAQAIRRAHGHAYDVLVQGDAPRTQLVARFREDVSSVLVGTRSLWAGVDVSGESLSAVVIDKLPFDSPDDPILDAKSTVSDRTFIEYSVPRAAIALRQGFGRLIRSTTDRGVVVICDRRLVDKPYGRRIRAALPAARFTRDLGEVARFFASPEVGAHVRAVKVDEAQRAEESGEMWQ